MGLKAEVLKIREEIEFDAVRWSKVLDLLVSKFKYSFEEADLLVHDFLKRFRKPFNLYWFLNRHLSRPDNSVLAAVCNCHGADTVVLHRRRALSMFGLKVEYAQSIEFEPNLRPTQSDALPGTCLPRIETTILRRKIVLLDTRQTVLFQAGLTLLALVAYVLIMGLVLYGLAVITLFVLRPYETTMAATRSLHLGFALLSVLVGVAGFFGRAVNNISRDYYDRYRKDRRRK
jgi:hypothetical protein